MAASDLFQLSQIADQVCLNYGSADDITQAKAKKWVNRALLRFSEMGDWSWQRVYAQSFNTVISTETYDLTSIKQVTSVYLASPIQRKLVLLEDRQFRRLYPNNTATGTPYYYRDNGWSTSTANTKTIGLYPIPSSVIAVKYDGIRSIQLLTADSTDVRTATGMPQHLVDLLIEMATAVGWKELDDAQAAAQMAECMARLKAAFQDDQSNIDDSFIAAPQEAYNLDQHFDPVLPSNYGW